jgi:peptidoglycan hydrolase-like protein with peptidoglycan-binding domain
MPSYVLPTLQLGSRGESVRKLQTYLNQLGQRIAMDGVFGPETRQAVINFQAQAGVRPIDGIVGQRTWTAIEVNLGVNVDVEVGGGSGGSPSPLPEIPDVDEPSWLTPGNIVMGAALAAAIVYTLWDGDTKSKRSR